VAIAQVSCASAICTHIQSRQISYPLSPERRDVSLREIVRSAAEEFDQLTALAFRHADNRLRGAIRQWAKVQDFPARSAKGWSCEGAEADEPVATSASWKESMSDHVAARAK